MIKENIYVAINHNDEIQWVKGSSSKTRYFRTDKYLKSAVEYHNEYHPEDIWKIRKCMILEEEPREGEQDPCNNCKYLDGDGCRLVFEQSEYGQASDECPNDNNVSTTVSRGVFEQVMWERDVAIGQLKELGYEFGEKIEPCEDCISRQAVLDKMKERDEDLSSICPRDIRELPHVTLQPKTAHWIMPVQDDGMSDPIYYQVRCSNCSFDLDPQTWHTELHQYGADKYCPKCGARIIESEYEE